MAKDKERTLNPAAAHLKSQKKTALKKGKAQVATQRNERLARRNPERLQKQIDELKEMEGAQGGNLRPRDKQALEQLERDVKAIRKARESQPDERRRDDRGGDVRGRGGYTDGRGGRGGGHSLGKRRRDSADEGHRSDATDEDVRRIPMPRDTPPPIPSRSRQHKPRAGNANDTPLGDNARNVSHTLPPKPAAVAQTTYSSAPQIRNLQREATSKFVPAAVAARLKQRAAFSGSGTGEGQKLLEPEEVDALERDGYLAARGAADEAAKEAAYTAMATEGGDAVGGGDLDEEEAAFQAELRAAEEELQKEGTGTTLAEEAKEAIEGLEDALNGEGKILRAAEQAMKEAPVEVKPVLQKNLLMRYQDVEDDEDDTWG